MQQWRLIRARYGIHTTVRLAAHVHAHVHVSTALACRGRGACRDQTASQRRAAASAQSRLTRASAARQTCPARVPRQGAPPRPPMARMRAGCTRLERGGKPAAAWALWRVRCSGLGLGLGIDLELGDCAWPMYPVSRMNTREGSGVKVWPASMMSSVFSKRRKGAGPCTRRHS